MGGLVSSLDPYGTTNRNPARRGTIVPCVAAVNSAHQQGVALWAPARTGLPLSEQPQLLLAFDRVAAERRILFSDLQR